MKSYLITKAKIVNEGKVFVGNVLIENDIITKVTDAEILPTANNSIEIIDASGKYLLPGIIDDQVHFREPGLTHKADIYTESRAAAAGGVTSYMEMPNTIPNVLTQELLEQKYELASKKSLVNYSFFMGASNDNIDEVLKTDPKTVCGVKIFMGSSTGNMLVDKYEILDQIFARSPTLIAIHSEDETTVRNNLILYKKKYGDNIPAKCHAEIRNEKACYLSTQKAVSLAKKHHTRLHVLHISTEDELEFFSNNIPLKDKLITAEACVHHLWFDDSDYEKSGNLIKCNPSIKKSRHKAALLNALLDNRLDIVATDHAPHTFDEKQSAYINAPSGIPLIQHPLNIMLELCFKNKISLEKIIEKMCHAPADCYKIHNRGYIKEGYYADLVLVDLNNPWEVNKTNIHFKCGWSPFEGYVFKSKITHTFVNGNLVYANGKFDESYKGKRLLFNMS